MTIKSILCAYSGEQDKGSVLDYSMMLAKRHDAWLTGILRHGFSKMERRIATIVADEVHRAVKAAELKRINDIVKRFHQIIQQNGLEDRSNFIDIEPEMLMTLSEIARTYDLVVTGTHADDENYGFLAAYPDRIALQSGRPVIVVPDDHTPTGWTDHVLIAWDGRRTVARAVGDLLPYLHKDSKVTLLTVGASHTVDRYPGGGIMTLFERHGIEAEHIHDRGLEKSTAIAILDCAMELEVDLIVMGAFEHSKFTQDIFGGVTTEMIRETRIPVFMSH
ncbi:Universal stress protein family protein [Cohaesibacter sp. ES.047]|uniref:universal stress protein n=1 Tax=Cohaesibacter sp. ES.047 TaxID=1798205 RepID=UPI000BC0B234|nr:universal stress protein [Cohaesibacter sp. ES.047]SNY92683.1 Universal stress protein family protein [Cohaesibacter sp. ES.047]